MNAPSTIDRVVGLVGDGAGALMIVGAASPGAIPAWLMIAATVVAAVANRATGKGIPVVSSILPGKLIPGTNQRIDPEDPKNLRNRDGMLMLPLLVGLALLSSSCAHFATSKETCLGKLDTPKEAVALVVPHLAAAAVCASQNVEDDAAALACVKREFEAMKAEGEPVVAACGVALIGDVVTAGK